MAKEPINRCGTRGVVDAWALGIAIDGDLLSRTFTPAGFVGWIWEDIRPAHQLDVHGAVPRGSVIKLLRGVLVCHRIGLLRY